MTRFAAYSSESSDEEELRSSAIEKDRSQELEHVEDDTGSESDESESSSTSGSEPSELLEDDLVVSSIPRRRGTQKGKERNALADDEDAHEADKRVSPGSLSSRSSPGIHSSTRGDPTIIPWAQKIGVERQRMHVMQASFFRSQEEAALLKVMNQPIRPKGSAALLGANFKISSRKHRRDSDGDAQRFDSRERASFAHDIDPPVLRPSRKYTRINVKSSFITGNEGACADAGLALGSSFRVGWGPGGRLVHLGSICGSTSTSQSSNSSTLTITRVLQSLSNSQPENVPSSVTEPLAAKLLQHHLSLTTISREETNVPRAIPHLPPAIPSHSYNDISSPQEYLNLASFISLFPSQDISTPSSVFRLGSALFDPIDFRLGHSKSNSITPEVRNRVKVLRRKAALSKWLEEVVKPSVDGDLRTEASGSNEKYTAADAAFSHLTGHQIDEACAKSSAGGYIKLATLISQAGGDELFKQDIRSQIEIWKSEKLAPGAISNLSSTQSGLVTRGVWRIYNLLAGLVRPGEDIGRPEDDICAGLDWKRVFGLCLWYGSPVDTSIADVVRVYEELVLQDSRSSSSEIARPIPKWAAEKRRKESQLPASGPSRLGLYLTSNSTSCVEDTLEDPLFALIKLHADPALSLSKALNPLSFSSLGVGFGITMCWHLYIVLSRVMRVRDFSDRTRLPPPRRQQRKRLNGHVNGISHSNVKDRGSSDNSTDDDVDDEDAVRQEGHSPTADLLTSRYAFELESCGLLQEAVFVLLHLEGSAGREKAIRDLLTRSGGKLDDWTTRGLIGSLKIPAIWIDEAKAIYELDCGNIYAAYELYLSAQQYNAAHNLAVLELAPDAVIRKDYELLLNLFNPLATTGRREKISGWFVRGQVFIDYAKIMSRLPGLLLDNNNNNHAVVVLGVDQQQQNEQDAAAAATVVDAAQAEEMENLSKRIPKIIAILPDILHRSRTVDDRHPAALEEMTKDLLKIVERAKPSLLSQIQQTRPGVLDAASSINLIKNIGYTKFLQSIEV